LHLLWVLEDFIVVCAAGLYLSLERGAKGTAKYVKYLDQLVMWSHEQNLWNKGRGSSTPTTYRIDINVFFISARVDADGVGSQNALGLQEKTIDLHCGGRKAPC
jgi:hypothetical protein